MKKTNFLLSFLLFFGTLLFSQTWDIMNKSMAAWNVNDGLSTNVAWSYSKATNGATNASLSTAVTQQIGYVNIAKTYAYYNYNYAFLVSPTMTLQANTAYTFEVKARLNQIDKTNYPDLNAPTAAGPVEGFESNQLSARLNNKTLGIHLKYGGANEGYVSIAAGLTHTAEEKYLLNTSEWHVYRFVFHADNLKYDVYVDDNNNPIFENVTATSATGTNILKLGAESSHRCNMDIEYAKMGTGDFSSTSKIVSIALSSDSHIENNTKTITATVNTVLINDNEKLLISLVDNNDNTVVNAVEVLVSQGIATTNFTIPSTIAKGTYFIKVTAPNGKIGNVNISPKEVVYTIYSSHFVGKQLVTFGNSITSAENSWAYQIYRKLGFADLYNGAVGGACWYKRARTAQDNSSITTQDYTDPNFAGMSNETNSSPEAFQRIINNCAVVHIQKYLIDKPTASPDYAVLSYGTNDAASSTMGSVEETMARSLDKVDLFTMAGALRWSIETLQTRFPAMLIYVALPIQAKDATKNKDNLKKIKVIKGICDALSISYFDCYNESTITAENQATYLRDGLHPNEIGKVVHGDYIIKKLEEAASSVSAVIQEEVREGTIAISTNVLNAGNHLSVKSLKNGSALEEMVLYNIVGNKVSHQSISDIEYTLQMPMVTGMYVLNVRLADKTSKGFKILVK